MGCAGLHCLSASHKVAAVHLRTLVGGSIKSMCLDMRLNYGAIARRCLQSGRHEDPVCRRRAWPRSKSPRCFCRKKEWMFWSKKGCTMRRVYGRHVDVCARHVCGHVCSMHMDVCMACMWTCVWPVAVCRRVWSACTTTVCAQLARVVHA